MHSYRPRLSNPSRRDGEGTGRCIHVVRTFPIASGVQRGKGEGEGMPCAPRRERPVMGRSADLGATVVVGTPPTRGSIVAGHTVGNAIQGLKPVTLALFGGWMLFLGGSQLWQRASTRTDGTVVSATTSTGNRPVTTYVLRAADGHETQYVAGPTDASLPRYLAVGTVLHKERWHLSFSRDGQGIETFPALLLRDPAPWGLGAWWRCFQVLENPAERSPIGIRLTSINPVESWCQINSFLERTGLRY